MTLTDVQWRAVMGHLVDYTALDDHKLQAVTALIREINVANGVTEYVVRIRWLDRAHPHPRPTVDPPAAWPPELTDRLVQTSPIRKEDIEALVARKSAQPIAIHVTRDPAGVVGWMDISAWGF